MISLALFYSGVDKRILVWDLAEGTLLTELKGHTDTVYSMRFSRDGNMLASGRYDHSLSRAYIITLAAYRILCNVEPFNPKSDQHQISPRNVNTL